ncbi:MAG TPA: DNA polymerase I [Alphaproteobacteria bacterium]|nr:DNA polymerase I [Alphaproteobacteria bacterium]
MARTSAAPSPVEAAGKRRHVFLIDGSGFLFRAFHALPPLTRGDGTPINAVLGFSTMLMKLLSETEADHVVVVFDASQRSFRNEMFDGYKAHRPEAPAELVPQFKLVREAARAFNVPVVEMEGFEADDIIATYASAAAERGDEVTIVSSDKDLMQLVGDCIRMLDPMKNRIIGPDEVKEKFGVGPDKVVDVQALIGDSVDNVPGVPGIGVKTAAELIGVYGDLDTLLARAGEIKQPKRREMLVQHADQARLSRELVRLKRNVPVPAQIDEFRRREPDPEALLAFLRENQFRSLITRVEAKLGRTGAEREDAPPKRPAAPRPQTYLLVDEASALEEWTERATAQGSAAIAVKIDATDPMRGRLIGISLALADGDACYVPLRHRSVDSQGALELTAPSAPGANFRQVAFEEALRILKPMLEDPAVLKVGHNIKLDALVLARHGIALAPVDDAMLISYVLEGGAHGHDLEELVGLHLTPRRTKLADVVGTGKSLIAFAEAPIEKARDCAAEDADVCGALHRRLKARLIEERVLTVYETIERPLVPVIVEMERAGIKVDLGELKRLSAEFGRRIAELEGEIHILAGREFNIGSPKQLGEVLFDDLNLPGGRKGKTGAYGTGAEILEALALEHPLPRKVLDWRQIAKLKNTYADALTETINPETGRVHTNFALAVASTGRLSSNDPNLQNIPIRTEEGRKIRRAFVAEEGSVLLSVDYSQIELRLAAEMADIAPLREAFRAGADIHALTASQVFGVPAKGMDPMVRRRAKAINFGIIYGISAFGLAAQLGIPQSEAAAYIKAYFERYPGIRDYMERTKKTAREKGFVTTLFGRRVHVPGINDRNPARRSFMERAAINAPLQGSAADIIKRAMIRVAPALKAAGLKARMLLQVHDELLFEVPRAETEETAALVRKVMEGAPEPAVRLAVPLVAEAGWGRNWAEAH